MRLAGMLPESSTRREKAEDGKVLLDKAQGAMEFRGNVEKGGYFSSSFTHVTTFSLVYLAGLAKNNYQRRVRKSTCCNTQEHLCCTLVLTIKL
jgi:hypothetical protein